jgi:ParB family chromosome partitioning protein
MLTEILNPKELLANPWNPNRLTPEAEMKLENSLARLGMFKPILVRTLEDGRREILGGENRARAAERLGWTEVPVYSLGALSDDQAKQIGLLDNTRYGHDDASVLAKLLEDLGSPTDLATFMPFDMAELDALSAVSRIDLDKIGLEDEDAPAIEDRPVRAPRTHATMRFKVPIEDQKTIEAQIKAIIADQGLEDSDSLVNAGDALVWLVREFSKR